MDDDAPLDARRPRALGPAGFGVIMAAIAITGIFAVVLGLGTRNYLVREIVVDQHEAPRLLGTARRAALRGHTDL